MEEKKRVTCIDCGRTVRKADAYRYSVDENGLLEKLDGHLCETCHEARVRRSDRRTVHGNHGLAPRCSRPIDVRPAKRKRAGRPRSTRVDVAKRLAEAEEAVGSR